MRAVISRIQPFTFHTQVSSIEPSPKPQTSREEEIQLSKLSFQFEDDPFENLTNTLNCLCERIPMAPPSSPNKAFFFKDEWLEEVKFEANQINSPSTTIRCSIWGTSVKALHNPTAEACGMSSRTHS